MSDIAIEACGLGKMYRIYDRPSDRLKQMLFGKYRQHGYGREFWALRDFFCTVRKGEMLGVIGRNGSGKSTLLQMLARTLEPSCGSISLHGRVSALLELGSGFNPEYSGRDNVFLAGAILGITTGEMQRRYDDILAFAGIGDFIDQPVKTYSSGMTVRLAFAVASSIDPDILIVDEALAVGDMVFQQRCFRRFREIRERGTTVIFVSHDLGSVVQYCDRAIVLNKGHAISDGTAKDMVDLYKRSLAADLTPETPPPASAGIPIAEGGMRRHFPRSDNCQEYGDGAATITDWGMFNPAGEPLRINDGITPITLRMTILFSSACIDPIAAFTFRDLEGNELCGSNTWFAGHPIGESAARSCVTVEFRFQLPLRPGGAALCLGCTEIPDCGLIVHHRLYDLLILETASPRQSVGVFDLHASVTIIHHAT